MRLQYQYYYYPEISNRFQFFSIKTSEKFSDQGADIHIVPALNPQESITKDTEELVSAPSASECLRTLNGFLNLSGLLCTLSYLKASSEPETYGQLLSKTVNMLEQGGFVP